jgi:hypothetical protein
MNISKNDRANFDNKKPKNLKLCLFHHSSVSWQSALAYVHVYDTDNQRIKHLSFTLTQPIKISLISILTHHLHITEKIKRKERKTCQSLQTNK